MKQNERLKWWIIGVLFGGILSFPFREFEEMNCKSQAYDVGYEDGFSFGETKGREEAFTWFQTNFKANIEYLNIDSTNEHSISGK